MKKAAFIRVAALTVNAAMWGLIIGGCKYAWGAPPEEGSKQWERMIPHAAFITSMYNKAGKWCCDWGDGRMGDGAEELKEFQKIDENGDTKYFVFVKRKIFEEDSHNPHWPTSINRSYEDAIPPAGKMFEIDSDHVLTVDNATVRKCLNSNSDTCVAPENNVLWLSQAGEVYCYWPQQRWTQNIVKQFVRLQP